MERSYSFYEALPGAGRLAQLGASDNAMRHRLVTYIVESIFFAFAKVTKGAGTLTRARPCGDTHGINGLEA
jgi:hypothetical protein